MSLAERRVMLVGEFGPGSLERSYRAAFDEIGFEITTFDLPAALAGHCRFGKFGKTFNRFVEVEPWTRKSNRDMLTQALRCDPDYLLTFGHYPIQAGALAQVRAGSRAKLIHIWPDTLLNLTSNIISCLPVFDLVACYSQSGVDPLQRLGARKVVWIPLAGDPTMHTLAEPLDGDVARYGADVTFIGGWRPEREAILSSLGSFSLKIWGPDWGRRCRGNSVIRESWQGGPLYEADFAKAIANSKISLNIIDPTNFPAANMRFFEVPLAGGLQVSSPCPEMDREFIHGEDIFYYRDVDELTKLIDSLLTDTATRTRVSQSGHAKVLATHTYTERALNIIQHLENGIH